MFGDAPITVRGAGGNDCWTPMLNNEVCQPDREPIADSCPSKRSLRGLDGINLLMADVRDGVGPYLSVFLKGGEHWDSGAIGIAMAASSIAAALCQIPAGLLVDETRAKRLLVAGSGLLVGLGCLLIVLFPRFLRSSRHRRCWALRPLSFRPPSRRCRWGWSDGGCWMRGSAATKASTTAATSSLPRWPARWASTLATTGSSISSAASPSPAPASSN